MEANIAIGVARAKEHEHATTRTAAVIPVLAILALVEIPAPEISFLSWLSFRGGSLC
jgi:hypothetical protein